MIDLSTGTTCMIRLVNGKIVSGYPSSVEYHEHYVRVRIDDMMYHVPICDYNEISGTAETIKELLKKYGSRY